MIESRYVRAIPIDWLFPIAIFAIRLIDQWREGVPQDALWMCNFGNLTMAVGLFFAQTTTIRASILWLLVGLPMWIWYLLQAGHYAWSSWFTHLGALLIGVIALHNIRAERRAWMWAFIGFIVLQQLCRMFTPAALNVNMSHGLKVGEFDTVWMSLVCGYWQFWLLSLPLVSACLWTANVITLRLFPPAIQTSSNSSDATDN